VTLALAVASIVEATVKLLVIAQLELFTSVGCISKDTGMFAVASNIDPAVHVTAILLAIVTFASLNGGIPTVGMDMIHAMKPPPSLPPPVLLIVTEILPVGLPVAGVSITSTPTGLYASPPLAT